MNMKTKKALKVVLPIILALISIFVVSKYAASPEFHSKTIASLDDKKTTVMELTAASTAASAAITLIPGDTATPIAEKLADLSTYFLLVLCAIYLEKYLVTITGYATFVILIPAACLLFSINVFWKNDMCKYLIRKLAVFGLAIVLVIPASVKVSDLIEKTYDSSIQATIESAKQTTEEIDEEKDEKKGFWASITDSASEAVEKVENILNNFVEALAVLIVTSCVIPIIVLVFFVWLIKMVLGINVNLPMKKS